MKYNTTVYSYVEVLILGNVRLTILGTAWCFESCQDPTWRVKDKTILNTPSFPEKMTYFENGTGF